MAKRKKSSTTKKTSSSGTSNKKSKKMFKKKKNNVSEMFQSLAEDPGDPNSVINMEGIAELGEKLGIDVTEDIRILVLLWKMDCKEKPGCITNTEWTNGCESLGIDNWESLKSQLPALDTGFLETAEFKDFYKFCFKFNLSGTHKTLDKELVMALLPLVVKDRVPSDRLETFCKFLEQSSYQQITMDQWVSFFDFTLEVPDLDDYDESSSAWPVLLDEYVEYMEELQKS